MCKMAFTNIFRHQRRAYTILHTVLNPRSAGLKLPVVPPTPPKSIILLTTANSAADLTKEWLSPLTNDGRCAVLAASVDSLPGLGSSAPARVQKGHSWLITDEALSISLPKEPATAISFSFSSCATRVTLPLANTLFQNGTQNTLHHLPATVLPVEITAAAGVSDQEALEFAHAQHDIKEAWQELGELMAAIGKRSGVTSKDIGTAATVVIPSAAALKTAIPLRAITRPRKIHSGMGNILKQLVSEEGSAQPASTELESAVQAISGRTISVFARITPAMPAPQEDIFTPPEVRIHKVLSGGGGWGAKAGLLSLDPGEYHVEDFARDFEESGGVRGVVKVGEYVQFFIAQASTGAAELGMRLGCVPRMEDVVGGQAELEEEVHVEGVFGGMAEEGVRLGDRKMDVPFGEVVLDLNS